MSMFAVQHFFLSENLGVATVVIVSSNARSGYRNHGLSGT